MVCTFASGRISAIFPKSWEASAFSQCVIVKPYKTDKSKRNEFGFGRQVMTDKKSVQLLLGPFLIQLIILYFFVLSLWLSEWIWLENAVGGSLACQFFPFLVKNSLRYNNIFTNNLLCVHEQEEKIPKKYKIN